MSTTTDSTHAGHSGLTGNLRHMIDEIDRFMESAVASGDQSVDAVSKRLTTQVAQMRDELADLEDAARDKARRAARTADRSMHEHPYGAVGVAVAIGLIVGFLAARR